MLGLVRYVLVLTAELLISEPKKQKLPKKMHENNIKIFHPSEGLKPLKIFRDKNFQFCYLIAGLQPIKS